MDELGTHPWRMADNGRIHLAFPMPDTPVFAMAVAVHNARPRSAAELADTAINVSQAVGSVMAGRAFLEEIRKRERTMRARRES